MTSGSGAPQGEEYFKGGVFPFVRVQDMGKLGGQVYVNDTRDHLNERGLAKVKLFPRGSVLFTKSGMSILLNQRAILGREMGVVGHIGIATPLGGIGSEWIYYWLRTVDFTGLTHATTLPSLKLSEVQEIATPVAPLPEQHRIVAKIEELFSDLDAGVAALQKVKAQLKRYRQAVLKAAVEGKLTAEWREANKGKIEPASALLERIREERAKKANGKTKRLPPIDMTDLPELPKGWCWARLEEISDALGGYAFKSTDYDDGGYQIVKIGNVKPRQLKLDENPTFISQVAPEIRERYLLSLNDIIITLTGTRRKRDYGFVAMVENQTGLLLNQRVGRLRFHACMHPDYFLLALQTDFFRDQFFQHETGNVGQGNASIRAITEAVLAVPPRLEQGLIVAEADRQLSVADEIEKAVGQSLKQSERLRQSILKRAFEGKLVPQDPNDEPADKLLERISAQKDRLGQQAHKTNKTR